MVLGVCRVSSEAWYLFLCAGSALCWSVRVCLQSVGKEEGGDLWLVDLYEDVKDCNRKYGLVVV